MNCIHVWLGVYICSLRMSYSSFVSLCGSIISVLVFYPQGKKKCSHESTVLLSLIPLFLRKGAMEKTLV